jgi:hypothetical protein
MASIITKAAAAKITGAIKVPVRKAASGAAEERNRTITIPHTEATKPILASASGRNIMPSRVAIVMVEAMAIQAIMAPQ